MSEQEQEQPEPVEDEQPADDGEDTDAEEEAADTEEQPEPRRAAEQQGFTPEELEKRFSKVDTSFKAYKNSIDRNLEEYALDLLGCPLCAVTPHPGFVNKHDLGRVPEEVQDNVRFFFGLARETDYRQDPGSQTCEVCGGLTKVRTGAVAGEWITRTCVNCKGYGFTPPPSREPGAQPPNGAPPPDAEQGAQDFQQPDRDNWGEPRVLPDGTLNANYGRQPQFKELHPVYGVTRDLTADELVTG